MGIKSPDWLLHEESEKGIILITGYSSHEIQSVYLQQGTEAKKGFDAERFEIGIFATMKDGVRITRAGWFSMIGLMAELCPLHKCFFVKDADIRRLAWAFILQIKIFAPGTDPLDSPLPIEDEPGVIY